MDCFREEVDEEEDHEEKTKRFLDLGWREARVRSWTSLETGFKTGL
jgi:hypothetical protein